VHVYTLNSLAEAPAQGKHSAATETAPAASQFLTLLRQTTLIPCIAGHDWSSPPVRTRIALRGNLANYAVFRRPQTTKGRGRYRLTSHRRSRTALFAASAAIAVAAIVPAAANAAVSITVTGDTGAPVALGGTLNIRNMNPILAITGTSTDYWRVSATGPNGAVVATDSGCNSGSTAQKYVDYVGNGVYMVTLTTYTAATCATATGPPQTLPFTVTASTAITPPPSAVLTRPARSSLTNTVRLPIDLNPGALATDAFAAVNVTPNVDGSLPGTPTQLFPDSTTRTVDVRLDKGPGTYVVAARAKGFTGSTNPQAFSPWATPVAFRAFAPFDLKSLRWTDSRGPSYRFHATIGETSATGSVSIAIGRGKTGKYKSKGTVKIRKHAFSKRFRIGVGTYRIRFKYKGNATIAGGAEIRTFRITRRITFRGAGVRSAVVG